MKRQTSQLGTGIFILTLLILGLFNKGSYGKVPVNPESVVEYVQTILSVEATALSGVSSINSLFVKDDGNGPTAMIILVAHNQKLTDALQTRAGIKETPLILSISTLPMRGVNFDPDLILFEQDGARWHPSARTANEAFPLNANVEFGGAIKDGQIHQGLVMLPDSFDIERPITISYLDSKRTLRF